LESLIHVLRVVAVARWGGSPVSAFEAPGLGLSHQWSYRGQVIPTNRRLTVQADVKARDDENRLLVADGHVSVDGKVIYNMTDFSLRVLTPPE
jgi:FabA-like domain